MIGPPPNSLIVSYNISDKFCFVPLLKVVWITLHCSSSTSINSSFERSRNTSHCGCFVHSGFETSVFIRGLLSLSAIWFKKLSLFSIIAFFLSVCHETMCERFVYSELENHVNLSILLMDE